MALLLSIIIVLKISCHWINCTLRSNILLNITPMYLADNSKNYFWNSSALSLHWVETATWTNKLLPRAEFPPSNSTYICGNSSKFRSTYIWHYYIMCCLTSRLTLLQSIRLVRSNGRVKGRICLQVLRLTKESEVLRGFHSRGQALGLWESHHGGADIPGKPNACG